WPQERQSGKHSLQGRDAPDRQQPVLVRCRQYGHVLHLKDPEPRGSDEPLNLGMTHVALLPTQEPTNHVDQAESVLVIVEHNDAVVGQQFGESTHCVCTQFILRIGEEPECCDQTKPPSAQQVPPGEVPVDERATGKPCPGNGKHAFGYIHPGRASGAGLEMLDDASSTARKIEVIKFGAKSTIDDIFKYSLLQVPDHGTIRIFGELL